MKSLVVRVRFQIHRNLETMHDWYLPSVYVRALRSIWKRTRMYVRGKKDGWED